MGKTHKYDTSLTFLTRFQGACQRYLSIKPQELICEYIQHKLFERFFTWIAQKEGEIDPEQDCQYMNLCPRPKGFEMFFKIPKVPDVPAPQ
ncbi:hypothetical protein GCK32_008555 [Trichostrongylus colubriformis]|uniref:Saposin B-type domain-containing protein n=1 Tax=Trichostrongylus colubriformis TaxID=6319 RepID=A0AAN8G2E6_TRICO